MINDDDWYSESVYAKNTLESPPNLISVIFRTYVLCSVMVKDWRWWMMRMVMKMMRMMTIDGDGTDDD
jgi:hypothetical protein